MAKITVNVVDRKNRPRGKFQVEDTITIAQFKAEFAKQNKKYYPSRQYFTKGEGEKAARLTDVDKKLTDYDVKDGDTLVFKDLGPQVSWTTVFLVEYFGPILVHALMFFFPTFFYPSDSPKSYRQQVFFGLVVFHYVKRELETLFVHRFSAETMPVFNIFKNSAHYWILSGVAIAYPVYHPSFTATLPLPIFNAGIGLFILCELGNFHAHLILRNLRASGTRQRGIPTGQMFGLVSCANYFWESCAWFVFAVMSDSLTAWVFWFVSTAQMFAWALKKHRNYRKEFGDKYPRGRKAMFPFLA